MIHPEIYSFLTQLQKNNNREWFAANKKEFEEAKNLFESFCNELILEVKSIDSKLGSVEAKDCIFRIYRDTRFATNKTPYKTNFGCYIAPGGRKSESPGYYIHLEPGNETMIAGGMYMPSPQNLEAIRQEILHNSPAFIEFALDPNFQSLFPDFHGERLKKSPKGYPKDFEFNQFLQLKSFTVGLKVDDITVYSSDFRTHLRLAIQQIKRLNDFLREAID